MTITLNAAFTTPAAGGGGAGGNWETVQDVDLTAVTQVAQTLTDHELFRFSLTIQDTEFMTPRFAMSSDGTTALTNTINEHGKNYAGFQTESIFDGVSGLQWARASNQQRSDWGMQGYFSRGGSNYAGVWGHYSSANGVGSNNTHGQFVSNTIIGSIAALTHLLIDFDGATVDSGRLLIEKRSV